MLPKPNVDGGLKDLKYNLNLMNAFLLSLVISFLVSQLKISRISLYKSMKPFRDKLDIIIRKYLCSFHDRLPGIDSISNEKLLIAISKYNSCQN